jgi:hypothetical protein
MNIDWSSAKWRKSTHSDSGACVEVAIVGDTIGVRDTKDNGSGPVLEFTEPEWTAFQAGTAAGEFSIGQLRATS